MFGRKTTGAAVLAAASGLALAAYAAYAAGDLTRQEPIDVRVDLGSTENAFAFFPSRLEFETGKLYRVTLRNPSREPHYFTAAALASRVFTRKVVVNGADGKALGEIKGTISEIEVFPGGVSEWWFVPLQTTAASDIICGIRDRDGKTHAEKGMTGQVVIR